ncbi:MAG: class I SAM-dependent DNA methyltransferase [Thermoplasmata archaeon]
MSTPEDFSTHPSRVRFLGSESEAAHGRMYGVIAEHYDAMYDSDRPRLASEFLHDVFQRHEPVQTVLDMACGTFYIDLEILDRGYDVVGCDVSPHMLKVAQGNLRKAGREAELFQVDMRDLNLSRRFDAVICLGTAFNYLHTEEDWRLAFQRFRDHLRPDGIVVLDMNNFERWIDDPTNAGVEMDYSAPDGMRIVWFKFNEQNAAKTQHMARFLTVIQQNDVIEVALDEAILKVWHKETLAQALQDHGFRPIEWWGDLKKGEPYNNPESHRLICVALRD